MQKRDRDNIGKNTVKDQAEDTKVGKKTKILKFAKNTTKNYGANQNKISDDLTQNPTHTSAEDHIENVENMIKSAVLIFARIFLYFAFAAVLFLGFHDLYNLLISDEAMDATKSVVMTIFNLLAVAEMISTIKLYEKDGRVHITYILDVCIILALKESVTRMYISHELNYVIQPILILLSLGVFRSISVIINKLPTNKAR